MSRRLLVTLTLLCLFLSVCVCALCVFFVCCSVSMLPAL